MMTTRTTHIKQSYTVAGEGQKIHMYLTPHHQVIGRVGASILRKIHFWRCRSQSQTMTD